MRRRRTTLKGPRGKGFNGLERLAQFVDLPGNTRLQVSPITQRDEFHAAFQRKYTFNGFINAAPQRRTAARGFDDCLESLFNKRRGLRKKKQVISRLESSKEEFGRQSEACYRAHRQIVGNRESLVSQFLAEETLHDTR